jgi:hypothetical protein
MKNNEVTAVEFQNIRELDALVLGLDTARLADVFVEDSKDKDHQAVVNDRTNKIEAIVSDQYALIQHREAFEPFVNAMRTLGIGVKGRVISDSGRAYIDVRFDDERFTIDVAEKEEVGRRNVVSPPQKGDLINFGFRLGNSYDKSTAFYAETYALRLVCLNGMIAPVKIKAIREVHIGDVRIVTKTLSVAIQSLMAESVKFADIVERARKEIVTEKLLNQLLVGWKLGKKHITAILEKARELDELNGYSIYNLLTSYITHNLQVRESTKEMWHKQYANPILHTPIPALIQKIKEQNVEA